VSFGFLSVGQHYPLSRWERAGVRIPGTEIRALNPCNLTIRKWLIINERMWRFMGRGIPSGADVLQDLPTHGAKK
jgi:hypothetical protein